MRNGHIIRGTDALRLGFVLALTAFTVLPARAQNDRIDGVFVADENRDSVTFDVEYSYSGLRGDNVFASVIMADNGKVSTNYAYQPGRVQRGHHRTRVVLKTRPGSPAVWSTNQIQVSLYVGGKNPFIRRSFSYAKTWSRPGAALAPVLTIIGPVHPLPPRPLGTPAGGGTTTRRVLPNGHVQLRYPDGTIRERFPGGESVVHPDGSHETVLRSSAQPPTPPSAPPDQAHTAWLDDENERLLDVIRSLVGNDDASVEHFLSQEGTDITPYQRVTSRTEAIYMLVLP